MKILQQISLLDAGRTYLQLQTRSTIKVWCLINGRILMPGFNDDSFKIPGGGMKKGESELDALRRELS